MTQFTPLAYRVAWSFIRRLPPEVPKEDIEAAAFAGLWEAALRAPGIDDAGFGFFAHARIRGSILDTLRTHDWLPRGVRKGYGEHFRRVGLLRRDDDGEFEERPELGVPPDAEEQAMTREAQAQLEAAIELLPERERRVVRAVLSGFPQKKLAAHFGFTPARLCQIYAAGVKMLQEQMPGEDPTP